MTRLEKLKEVETELKNLMGKANSRTFAQLSKEYRATIREIEEIEGAEPILDEIEDILKNRKDTGKSGAVRKDRSKVQGKRRV